MGQKLINFITISELSFILESMVDNATIKSHLQRVNLILD